MRTKALSRFRPPPRRAVEGLRALGSIALCLLAGGTVSCLSNPAELGGHDVYVAQFQLVWQTADQVYPAFHLIEADWDEVYDEYLQKVESVGTQHELIMLLVEMLTLLEDAHVWVETLEGHVYPTYIPAEEPNWDEDVLWAYIDSLSEDGFTWFLEDTWGYAMLDSIPYVMVVQMRDAINPRQLQEMLDSLPGSPPLIIDVRMNGGGTGGTELIDQFSSEYAVAYWKVWRDGPDHDDLGGRAATHVYPYSGQYPGPVMLLIGGGSASCTEMMAMMARAMPDVTLAGDTTMGQVTTGPSYRLGRGGYKYRMSEVTVLSADETRWIQGNGVVPDVYVEATEADFAAGGDPVLDYALEWAASRRSSGR